jgi:hypothetical protein
MLAKFVSTAMFTTVLVRILTQNDVDQIVQFLFTVCLVMSIARF